MNFFSDDHAAELRELFFESATELLQTLNEEGLELEKRPEDEEILRQVRRTVHTLKGDSAACGYTELSETGARAGRSFAAGDCGAEQAGSGGSGADRRRYFQFHALRVSRQPAAAGRRRAKATDRLAYAESLPTHVRYKLQARFVWSEYEQMVVADALGRGENVYNVAFSIEPQCPMRGAAMQLIRNVLQDCGRCWPLRRTRAR